MSDIILPYMHFVPKLWGFERWIVNNEFYCGKILFFAQGYGCSFHYHKLKKETFYLQSGKAIIFYSNNLSVLESKSEEVERVLNWFRGEKLQKHGIYHVELQINYAVLNKNDIFNVDPLLVHKIFAVEDSTILEISTHHDDLDSYRITKSH